MKTISIFGASVTQQKKGYAKYLSNMVTGKVSIYGYGGMHLNNAAICFLDEVLQDSPTVCLIDWFSTGYVEINDFTIDCIEYLISKLTEINCKAIFIFFPHKKDKEREFFYQFCKKIIREKGAEYFDIRHDVIESDLNNILRDDVHTTRYGSELYAKVIKEKLDNQLNLIQFPKNIRCNTSLNPQKLSVEKTFYDKVNLRGECEIIGFLLTIGPHTGYVNIINGKCKYAENLRDRWCNFNRKHFNLSFNVSGEASIEVVSSTKRSQLIIHDIYFNGKSLSIENIREGKRIKYIYIKVENFLSKLRQKFRFNRFNLK